jgi:hypothetical protein
LGVEALLVKLAELARKKATILCGGVDFCLFLLLTLVLTRRPLLFKEKKKPTLLFWPKRERDPFCCSLFIKYKIGDPFLFILFQQMQRKQRKRDPFFFLFNSRKHIEKETLTFSP